MLLNIAVTDTETTGYAGAPHAAIVEVAAMVVEFCTNTKTITLGNTFESIVRPEGRKHHQWQARDALRINRLTTAMLDVAPSERHVGQVMQDWLDANEVDCVVAFNNAFDFHANLLGAPWWLGSVLTRIPKGPCLMRSAQRTMGLTKQPSLSRALTHFGVIQAPDSHSALADVKDEAQLLPHVWPVEHGVVARGKAADISEARAMSKGRPRPEGLLTRAEALARLAM